MTSAEPPESAENAAKNQGPCETGSPFRIGDAVIWPGRNLVVLGEDQHQIQPKVMRLLCVLAANAGDTLSRRSLVERVWDGLIVSDAAIDRAVCQLRKALRDEARDPRYIETVRKKGIRLMVGAELLDPHSAPAAVQARHEPAAGFRLANGSRQAIGRLIGLRGKDLSVLATVMAGVTLLAVRSAVPVGASTPVQAELAAGPGITASMAAEAIARDTIPCGTG